MYDKIRHQGKLLAEWQKELKNQFTLGELYLMSKDKTIDFEKIVRG